MASPPYSATSPPGPSTLALPKQRPTLALPGGVPKSRKPSIASNTSSAHPLRQTSFPPAENLQAQHAAALYSPVEGGFEDDLDFSDSEIVSAISGPAGPGGEDGARGTKRKRGGGGGGGGKGGRPRKKRGVSESVVNGEDGTPARAAKSGADADDEDEDEGGEETDARGGRVPAYEGAQMTKDEFDKDEINRAMLAAYMATLDNSPLTSSHPDRHGITRRDFEERYNTWKATKLRSGDVRKLVNQTVSQSVGPPIVLAVQAYTKLFAGMLVQGAREVQGEWMAVEEKRADGEENAAFKRLRRSYVESAATSKEPEQAVNGQAQTTDETVVKDEPSSPDARPTSSGASQVNGANGTQSSTTMKSDDTEPPLYPGGASALQTSIEECDRGPLLPDHLREALRRYKKAHRGGAVGFTGYSLEGKTGTAARMGGRRLFR